jgi:porphobilinogen deaminase
MAISLRVGTRGSALALTQTAHVVELLGVEAEIVTIKTSGDASQKSSFEAIGPKGVFARELQRALTEDAAAGLIRLQREDEATEWLDPAEFVPAPGQGALAIEALSSRVARDLAWITGADDAETRICVETERAFMRLVESGCDAPLGAWARREDGEIVCTAFVTYGEKGVTATARGTDPDAVAAELEQAVSLT